MNEQNRHHQGDLAQFERRARQTLGRVGETLPSEAQPADAPADEPGGQELEATEDQEDIYTADDLLRATNQEQGDTYASTTQHPEEAESSLPHEDPSTRSRRGSDSSSRQRRGTSRELDDFNAEEEEEVDQLGL